MTAPAIRAQADEPPSDDLLIEQINAGDEAAFNLLYERYFDRVYRFVYSRLRNREDTEETVQEAFLAVVTSIDSYRGESSFAGWIFGVARHATLNRFKKKRHPTVSLWNSEEPELNENAPGATQKQPSPEEIYEYRERLAQINQVTENELSPLQREMFERHHVQHQSIGRIARTLNKTENAVKSNLYRARRILLSS